MKIAVVIPTYNAGEEFRSVLRLIVNQSENIEKIIVIDSSSEDNTIEITNKFGIENISINKRDFDHGGTRSLIAKKLYIKGFKYAIFMTQDVYLQDNALNNLIEFILENPNMGVARGKQEVDMTKGNIFEYHARLSNYGNEKQIFSRKDIKKYGIDTIYTSDAFAIYDLEKLSSIDYFGNNIIVSEDMLVAHKLIQNNFQVGYTPNAKVYHTHNYSLSEEFKRYFLIGRFHGKYEELLCKYGKTNSKGIDLVIKEIIFLYKNKKSYKIPEGIIRNVLKFIGFQFGKLKERIA